MVYAIDSEATFHEMEHLKEKVSEHCNPLFFLVGNKVDLDGANRRVIERQDGENFSNDNNYNDFQEISGFDYSDVKNLFFKVRDALVR